MRIHANPNPDPPPCFLTVSGRFRFRHTAVCERTPHVYHSTVASRRCWQVRAHHPAHPEPFRGRVRPHH